jgi:hypothetical protein
VANRSAVIVVTRTREQARAWARARNVARWVWPLNADMVSTDPRVGMVMLPDWGLHPDSRRLAEVFYRRLRG